MWCSGGSAIFVTDAQLAGKPEWGRNLSLLNFVSLTYILFKPEQAMVPSVLRLEGQFINQIKVKQAKQPLSAIIFYESFYQDLNVDLSH